MATTNLLRVDAAFQKHASMMAKEAGGSVRVGTRGDIAASKNSTKWTQFTAADRAVHHLRVVLPHEIVFDVGDNTPWHRTVDETHALWIALNRMGIPYWGALSGGKGTHTHVFGVYGSNPAAEKPPVAHEPLPRLKPEEVDRRKVVADAPPCIQRIFRALAAGKNVPHAGRFSAASYFHHAGLPKEVIAELFVKTPNYSKRETMKHIDSIEANNYLPFSCLRLKSEEICHQYIEVTRCSSVTNPISFLRKRTRQGAANAPGIADATPAVPEDVGPADWRYAASGAILEVAGAVLSRMTGTPLDSVTADYRLLGPGKDSRLCREFGRRKSITAKERKVIWTEGPGPFKPLPSERRDAYAIAEESKRIYPTTIPRSTKLALFDRGETGAACPTGPGCIPGHPQHKGSNPNGCETCPLRGA